MCSKGGSVLAIQQPEADGDIIAIRKPVLSSEATITNLPYAVDNDTSTSAIFPNGHTDSSIINIDVTLPDSFTARSLVFYMAKQPIKAMAELQVNNNGTYRTIKQFEVDRSNPELHVGFMPYAPVTISFKEETAKHLRLRFSHIHGKGGIAEIQLLAAPRIERFPEKQLAKMFQTPLPLWNEYQWPSQLEATDKNFVINSAQVIDLTKYLSADETLNWKIPPGNWIIVRYCMVPTGVTNSPASPEGRGFEVDKMNKEALVNHFNSFVGKIQERLSAANGRSLKFVVAPTATKQALRTGQTAWQRNLKNDRATVRFPGCLFSQDVS